MPERTKIYCLPALLGALLSLACVGPAVGAERRLKLATTTSTQNSGLLDVIVPPFEKERGVRVDVIAVGTGKALKLGANGDVDVLLVHAKPAEVKFVNAGHGVNRRELMYNDFIIIGPEADPAAIRGMKDAARALKKISASKSTFISRGDDSGTNKKELILWRDAAISPSGEWYIQIGQGMGQTLQTAHERQAYTLTDRGTYLAYRSRLDLTVLVEGDPKLQNLYSVMAVNPARYEDINYAGAMELIAWLTSPRCQRLIGDYRRYGQTLFHPLLISTEARGKAEGENAARQYISGAFRHAIVLLAGIDREVAAIAIVSLKCSTLAILFASLIGVPLGFMIGAGRFAGRGVVISVSNTLMALPTVVVGLTVYSFIARGGPLQAVDLLYSQTAIVIGQSILATPIVVSLTIAAVRAVEGRVKSTARTLGAGYWRAARAIVWEARFPIMAAVISGYGRVIAELGVAMMLGGNIKGHTRTLTTTIALETSRGEFSLALALGVILLALAFAVNIALLLMQRRGD